MSNKRVNVYKTVSNGDVDEEKFSTPVKKGRANEVNAVVTPENSRSSYASAMKELAGSFSVGEEV
jgi:hypothetical protein